jgi:hypothetical protein
VATRTPQAPETLTPEQALAFVERHGVVCESARVRDTPSLADAIAGEPIRGRWWSHRASKRIFALTRAVRDAPQVLVCTLVEGKITFVHDRLWPALVCVSERLPKERLARLREVHSARGQHVLESTPFPDWVPGPIASAAKRLDENDARALFPARCFR